MDLSFPDSAQARKVADAVLYEGYLLYPYRASAKKNQMRWQWGVVVPRAQSETAGEPWAAQAELLVDGSNGATVRVQARYLQLETRTGDQPWDEGVEREITVDVALETPMHEEPFALDGGADPGRSREQVTGRLSVSTAVLPGPYGVTKVRVRLENLTPWSDAAATRDEVVRRSLVGVHVLASVNKGRFLSLVDPPEWARPYVEGCEHAGLWPVLVGDDDDLVLAAPIILEEHPQIAPESQGDLFDATEIDEILSLRTLTLTDDEKAEARATDPRAAAVIDRVDSMPGEILERLHGAIRSFGPPNVGTRVRLRPRAGADAQDMFLDDQIATVEAVLSDVDGGQHVAVLLVDDPGADVKRAQGRFLYFKPDEVKPL
jgi:hypothetical protein